MAFSKHICLLSIVVLLAAHAALAQHAAIHFIEHNHEVLHGHDGSHNDKNTPNVKDTCQICISSKSTVKAYLPDEIYLNLILTHTSYEVLFEQNYITRKASQGFLARAPPSSLI